MTDRKCGKLNIITGPMFSGKCLQKGTEIIMYDGHLKKVEDVVMNDQLMGDDSKPRTVLNTAHGVGSLYKVSPSFGKPYVVNDQHILSLKCSYSSHNKGTIIDIPIQDYMNESHNFQSYYKGYRVGVEFPTQSVPLDPYILGTWLVGSTSRETDPEIMAKQTKYAKQHGLPIHMPGEFDLLLNTFR